MGMTEVPLWDGTGPVDGDLSTASLTRSGLSGYAGTLELLLLLLKVHQLLVAGGNVITWMDSSGALDRLSDLSSPHQSSCQYPDDADVLSHIAWLWRSLPDFNHVQQWVKAHQDADRPFAALNWSARLNVMADLLATAYYEKTDSCNWQSTNPLFFPSCRVSLLVKGQQVTSNYKNAIRFHIKGTAHHCYLQHLVGQKTQPGIAQILRHWEWRTNC